MWTTEEINFIKANAGTLSDKKGAEEIDRLFGRKVTMQAWRKQRQKLGLKKEPGRYTCRLSPPGKVFKRPVRKAATPVVEQPAVQVEQESTNVNSDPNHGQF